MIQQLREQRQGAFRHGDLSTVLDVLGARAELSSAPHDCTASTPRTTSAASFASFPVARPANCACGSCLQVSIFRWLIHDRARGPRRPAAICRRRGPFEHDFGSFGAWVTPSGRQPAARGGENPPAVALKISPHDDLTRTPVLRVLLRSHSPPPLPPGSGWEAWASSGRFRSTRARGRRRFPCSQRCVEFERP